jgi:hypothetical protein
MRTLSKIFSALRLGITQHGQFGMKPVRLLALLILGMGLPVSSYAAPLVTGSQLDIVGSVTSFNGTTINFTNPVSTTGSPSGSFAAFGSCSNCILMTTPWTWGSDTGTFLVDNGGGLTTLSFDVNSRSGSFTSPFLNITFYGIINLDGFSPTAGQAIFSGNSPTGGSFSLTLRAVPEPPTLALLGAALLALGFLQFRRMRAA